MWKNLISYVIVVWGMRVKASGPLWSFFWISRDQLFEWFVVKWGYKNKHKKRRGLKALDYILKIDSLLWIQCSTHLWDLRMRSKNHHMCTIENHSYIKMAQYSIYFLLIPHHRYANGTQVLFRKHVHQGYREHDKPTGCQPHSLLLVR